MFAGRNLLIVTKHKKETVMAPLLEKELGVHCFTSEVFDTDSLGTFSGEIERKDDALTTIRNKCIEANKLTNCDLVIASEGSFGAHPSIFFAQADDELVMLKDFKNDLEIVARELSLETNFNGKIIESQYDLMEFAKKVQFLSHAIILKSSEKNFKKSFKGITDEVTLLSNYHELKSEFGTVYAETDMRAMYNPMRMNVIEKAMQNLLHKIKNQCPSCQTPGFDILKANAGLPCENCNLPTRSTLSFTYFCKKCNYQEEALFPKGKKMEDPTYCDNCNP
jgi:hypothetical protein